MEAASAWLLTWSFFEFTAAGQGTTEEHVQSARESLRTTCSYTTHFNKMKIEKRPTNLLFPGKWTAGMFSHRVYCHRETRPLKNSKDARAEQRFTTFSSTKRCFFSRIPSKLDELCRQSGKQAAKSSNPGPLTELCLADGLPLCALDGRLLRLVVGLAAREAPTARLVGRCKGESKAASGL